ncbi:hypothetical protein O181_051047 [Austropuccinia psidii MF-1]|uniref:CCHC-type domain-containing protein n=1 Tax=Austropuccinia psidii MF-1 TaxID=1389203 RepID=A0A9Q3HP60_9BASI|nr:hypothetical protein [Austropuccinia psidii MF-1]
MWWTRLWHWLKSPSPMTPWHQAADIRQPPDHLVNKFGAVCFHCGCPGHWRADCPNTRGVANPTPRQHSPFHKTRPRTLEERPPYTSGSLYQ